MVGAKINAKMGRTFSMNFWNELIRLSCCTNTSHHQNCISQF